MRGNVGTNRTGPQCSTKITSTGWTRDLLGTKLHGGTKLFRELNFMGEGTKIFRELNFMGGLNYSGNSTSWGEGD